VSRFDSGARTAGYADRLSAKAGLCEAYTIEGGLDAWKRAGLPVTADRRQPLELARQVQIAAGSLVVLGVLLGSLVSPWLYALSGFVGAGLASLSPMSCEHPPNTSRPLLVGSVRERNPAGLR
jgi:hypothetical protein